MKSDKSDTNKKSSSRKRKQDNDDINTVTSNSTSTTPSKDKPSKKKISKKSITVDKDEVKDQNLAETSIDNKTKSDDDIKSKNVEKKDKSNVKSVKSTKSTKSKKNNNNKSSSTKINDKIENTNGVICSSDDVVINNIDKDINSKDISSKNINSNGIISSKNINSKDISSNSDLIDMPEESLKFSSYNISKKTIESLEKREIKSLFPIQAKAFNPIYNGNDVLGRAKVFNLLLIFIYELLI
jgi:hypothetical protein